MALSLHFLSSQRAQAKRSPTCSNLKRLEVPGWSCCIGFLDPWQVGEVVGGGNQAQADNHQLLLWVWPFLNALLQMSNYKFWYCVVNPCSRIEDVTNYQNALSKALLVSLSPFRSHPFPILQARWLKLSEMTGCMPLCSVRFLTILPTTLFSLTNQRSFTFVEKTSEEANWARNWSSAFYLDVKTSSFIHQTEFYACNWESFLQRHFSQSDISSWPVVRLLFIPDDVGELASGLGGFMGIFLGW